MTNQAFPERAPEKFVFVQRTEDIHDAKFETKAVGYFGDAWSRFKKNKGSVVAAIIIVLLILFAVLTPIFSTYNMAFTDVYYTYALPKSKLTSRFGFWDGCSKKTVNQQTYDYYKGMGAIVEVKDCYESTVNGRTNTYYDVVLDSYKAVGYVYINLTPSEYQAALDYQSETGVQLFYPLVNTSKVVQEMNKDNANYWYEHDAKGILFIAHDLSVVKYFSDRIGVMYFGHLVELATSDELFARPLHGYTRALLSAIPMPDPHYEKRRRRIVYQQPEYSPAEQQSLALREIFPGHFVRCTEAEAEAFRRQA